jgi:hypothetical protein
LVEWFKKLYNWKLINGRLSGRTKISWEKKGIKEELIIIKLIIEQDRVKWKKVVEKTKTFKH